MAATFPLPRSSFKLLRLILIGYLHEGGNERKPSGLSNVGSAIGLDPTIVSRNNAPLAALGLLEGAENRRWRLTDGGIEVARALEWDAPDDARETLAGIFRSNEFVQRIVTYVRAQGGVETEQVVSQMARSAGVKKTSEYLTGARALLELMELAGLVVPDGDTVRVPTQRVSSSGDSSAAKRTRGPSGPTGPTGATGPTGPTSYGGLSYSLESLGPYAPSVTIHLNVSPADLKTDAAADALAVRIKRLVDALRSN